MAGEPSKANAQSKARGYGPNRGGPFSHEPYRHPAAAWGASLSVAKVLLKEKELVNGTRAVFRMNQEASGFDCPGCAWPDDRNGLKMDICENGIKHATWEMTPKRVGRAFFAEHSVSELMEWSDFALEDAGRLTEPMQYDAATDRYIPVSWQEAFTIIGSHLRCLASPHEATFYTSGRLSNEATFLYQLFAREFGTNNLPDCSNMCHEASGRALKASLATGKGTVDLEDLEKTDFLVVMGLNAASNTPRFLTALADAYRRGAQIVHINPLVEVASTKTIVPHDLLSMATFQTTRTGTLDIQPRIAGDMALMRGVAKYLFELSKSDPGAIDTDFLNRHTLDWEAYRTTVEATAWETIVQQSGVSREQIEQFGKLYRQSTAAVFGWCLGISQQEHAVDAVREIVNVLLLRGNLGRPGAGAMPVRGHSNVQGNRTCGIDHHPQEAWLARMDQATGIRSPREQGVDTVGSIQGMAKGAIKVFVGMGGNFALATPDPAATFTALCRCDLTVQVSTKLNRSHLVHGREALILPCLGRSEKDISECGEQGVSVEDSMSCVHLSYGMKQPASEQLISECAIIAGIAQATLPDSRTPWSQYAVDYDAIRDTMAEALVGFESFNERVREPNGFRLAQPARELEFLTPSGKAEYSTAELPDVVPPQGRLILGTVRSHDQWNTSIYSDNDRYRGVKNLRTLIFMNEEDMRERGLEKFSLIDITSFAKDGSQRSLRGYRAIPYAIPRGCAMGYMPELNVLCALENYSRQSNQPMMKQLLVEIKASA